MAMVAICSSKFSKEPICPITKSIRQCQRDIPYHHVAIGKMCRCFSSSEDAGRRWQVMHHNAELYAKPKIGQSSSTICLTHNKSHATFHAVIYESTAHRVYSIYSQENSISKNASQRVKYCSGSYESDTSGNGGQLKALDSYFSKLQNETSGQQSISAPTRDSENVPRREVCQVDPPSQSPDKMIKAIDGHGQLKTKKGIGSLDDYFDKLNTGEESQEKVLSSFNEDKTSNLKRGPLSTSGKHYKSSEETSSKLNDYIPIESEDDENGQLTVGDENVQDLEPYDETSDLYLISILASINIAVFLFEIASPIRNSDVERLSLPLIYGAKINELILDGEWWRLVTPMFLHSGFLHVAFGCWVLLTFGAQVCREYGSFTFFLIYILGGISGNLSSFVHTPELTVGGTGPVFAVLGAWFIYQIQNKEMIPKEETENMFRKAVITTVLTFLLCNFDRIDNWTHLGAACAGLAYGFFTCPMLQVDNASSKNGQKEGIALIRQQADPCKSFITFVFFIVLLSSLFFFFGSQADTMELTSFE